MIRFFTFLTLFYSSYCFTNINYAPVLKKSISVCKMQEKLENKQFNKIDKDKSGYIDKNELVNFFGNDNLIKIGDLNKDNLIDYPEFERLVNINKFGIENSGNLFVRNAIKFGLLDKNSILADGKASIFVGNKGFDPLNCATNMKTLKKYREAEIKHGRLAMLASIGWPFAELYHPFISKLTKNEYLLSSNNKVPSLLNGGLGKINPIFFMAIIIFTATVESIALSNNYRDDRMPGDLGFDPLKLYVNKDPYKKRELELKELNNGRLAMLAITYYAISEYLTNTAVINKTPYLFKSFL
jgi:hypothetical protein